MGWNSWDSYARTVTERDVKANAEWMASHLKAAGWQYIVIDEGWYIRNPEAEPRDYQMVLSPDGRYMPSPNRFPSANGELGMKPLADSIHALGLKFGIHILRGIPREAVQKNLPIAGSLFHAAEAADASDTCPWNAYNYGVKENPAGQAYYDSLANLYSSWGVDFLKVDCIADHPYKPAEIRMIRTALRHSGRSIVLSLSPGPTAVEHAEEVAQNAEMWRISDDFWDHWGVWPKHAWSQGLLAQFATAAQWSAHSAPGHWPDADMLPLGHLGPHPGEGEARDSHFTHDEQRTLLTLWCVFHSPLMMGGNLLAMDDWTTGLLNNPEVLRVDQASSDSKPAISTPESVIWTATPTGMPGKYVAVFNLSEQSATVEHAWSELGLSGSSFQVRDLWERSDLGNAKKLQVNLAPHASALFYLSAPH